ncbi:hypothetical protein OYT13_16605 [Pandoraea sp. XJJ-1]|uniref:hypothetical protein n=1 Tax=Pandoraea sp. XJJ-1 TaxID=3002643 RepID=UPI00227F8D11|nr:hypothetical protein [Pandoraea sp. XJJ-1]WAL81460.1 hypothetical protein OYT13_16605 [Pandoraea sp. XJJ-1]
MKKILVLLAAGIAAFIAAGCASQSATIPPVAIQSPAQIAARACPLLTDELSTLALAGVFTGGAQDTLTKEIQPAVDKVCEAGAVPTQLSLQTLSKSVTPLLVALVKASSLPDVDKTKAILVIGTSKAVLDTALIALAPPAAAAEVPAAASAPVAK